MSLPPPLPLENPYAAPSAHVDDVMPQETVLADRGVRLAAAIVDGLALVGPAVLLAILVPALAPREGSGDAALALVGVIGIASVLAVLVINSVLLHRDGQTIGKRLLAIKIVLTDGGHCSLVRVIFARWLPVTVLGLIPVLGYVVALVDCLMIFREDRRCLHDLIAGTMVIRA